MLRIIQNTSAAGAKGYYTSADYYSEGQELTGRWAGKGAALLGLSGEVGKSDWDALCDNHHPQTLKTLTARQKEPRRIGYDFSFHAPKSLSLLYGMTGDERLLEAFRAAVDETMQGMEAEMQTRVRKDGGNADRTTGTMVWGEFVHTTARPVGGIPDPHLHAHCFVFNTTWDPVESRWKAGQFSGLKRDAPYFEAVFHSRLAERMQGLGLAVERTKAGWELAGLSKKTLNAFSRRTAQVEQEAKDKGITNPKAKDGLGAKTREHKAKHLSLPELRQEWLQRLTQGDAATLRDLSQLIGGPARTRDPAAVQEGVDHALLHCFERSAVVPERQVLREALRHSVGKASPQAIEEELQRRSLVRAHREGRTLVTTPGVLAEEQRMIAFARQGRGTRAPLGGPDPSAHVFTDQRLNAEQRRAVLYVLGSSDRVILIRGAAGVGKTTMMTEAVHAIEEQGTQVFTFAPSADASRGVLRTEGFENADTVARLLVDEKLQQEVRGGVLWIDEAGLLGSKTMGQVFDLAGRLDARVVLSGDRRQHGSVERGSPLRLLETDAGLVPAQIREIQRQGGDYKQVVYALSEGRVEDGFKGLDRLGWIRQVADENRYQVMAQDYVQAGQALKEGEKALIVCPTRREGEKVTSKVRAGLKASGRLGTQERSFTVLKSMDLTEAQRADPLSYDPDDVLVFHQNARGYQKGERVVVGDVQETGEAGTRSPLLDQAALFQAFRTDRLQLAAGDLIRITRNGTTADGEHKLNNGALYTVKGFTRKGDITLDNGWTVAKDYGHLAHGYVVTSHASQGKSVKQVFIAQGSESFPASSREQFYVSVSRGKKQATIYTDDKQALLEAVRQGDERLTATDLVGERERRDRVMTIQRNRKATPAIHTPSRSREQEREVTLA